MFKKRVRMKWMAGVLATVMTITLLPVSECPKTAEAKSVPKLNAKKVILKVGKKVSLKVKKAPSGVKITWKSKNKKIATVSKKGLVSAKKKGKTSIICTVKAKANSNGKVKKYRLKCAVSVKAKKTESTRTTVSETQSETKIADEKNDKTENTNAVSNTVAPSATADLSRGGNTTEVSTIASTRPAASASPAASTRPVVYPGGGGGSFSGSSSGSGSSAGTNSSASSQQTGGNSSSAVTTQTAEPVKTESGTTEEKNANFATVTLVDMTWSKWLAVSFADGYSVKNCTLNVDGADITNAVTNVSDDGSVVKWEVTTLYPAKLTVSSDGKVQSFVFDEKNTNPEVPAVSTEKTSADYILAHGSVAYWDYYLTNYDDAGNLRVKPKKTTFAKDITKNTGRRYYAPDAEIIRNGYNVSGEVQVMFNYTSADDKAWFDAIAAEGALELAKDDDTQIALNGNLAYEKTFTTHAGNTVGLITIPIGQGNFNSNGRYRLRIHSSGYETVMARIHVVEQTAPTLQLKEAGSMYPGQNIHFAVNGAPYAVDDGLERATLKTPSGEVVELQEIDDCYRISQDLFVLYNDPTRNDGNGVNHTAVPGKYTITVYETGYKPMAKSFEVVSYPTARRAKKLGSYVTIPKVDARTGATVSITEGSSGSSGGGSAVSANLLFDVDLLVNATIFDRMGFTNAYATGIVERYETEVSTPDAIFSKDGVNVYDFVDYYNAVSDARLDEGKYLTFAAYKAGGKGKTISKPATAKAVLEDNLLGDIQEYGAFYGEDAESLKLKDGAESVYEDEDVVLVGDKDFIDKITGIAYTENAYPVTTGYTKGDGELTISKSNFTDAYGKRKGDHTIIISSEGYQKMKLTIRYVQRVEDITLRVVTNPLYTGQDVEISLDGSSGGFASYFDSSKSSLTGVNTLLPVGQGAEGTGYTWKEDENGQKTIFVLKGGYFSETKEYTLSLAATGYESPLAISFTMEADPNASSGGGETLLDPTGYLDGITVQYNSSYPRYELLFKEKTGEDVSLWQKNITDVYVNNVKYENYTNTSALYAMSYKNYCNNASQYKLFLKKEIASGEDGIKDDMNNKIRIVAEGYKTVELTLNVVVDDTYWWAVQRSANITEAIVQ